jgi:putative membrane protein
MKRVFLLVAATAVFFGAGSCQNSSPNYFNNSKVDSNSYKFVKNSLEGGIVEIKASGLAITNSNNLRVIGLAKMIIAGQAFADSTLQNLETQKNIAGNDTLPATEATDLTALSKKTGPDFDKAYISMMIDIHRSAIDLCSIATNSTDKDVSAFATKDKSMSKMHLDSALAILASLK